MNCAKQIMAAIAAFGLAAFGDDVDRTITFKGQPPWRSNTTYKVVNKYDLQMDNITLKIDVHGSKWWNKKISKHLTLEPFSASYHCQLEYNTHHVRKIGGQQGSAFREFMDSSVEFHLGSIPDITSSNWWREFWNMEAKTEVVSKEVVSNKIDNVGKNADFAFRQLYEPNSNKMDCGASYMIYWSQVEAFSSGNGTTSLEIFKGPRLTADLSDDERSLVEQKKRTRKEVKSRPGFQVGQSRLPGKLRRKWKPSEGASMKNSIAVGMFAIIVGLSLCGCASRVIPGCYSAQYDNWMIATESNLSLRAGKAKAIYANLDNKTNVPLTDSEDDVELEYVVEKVDRVTYSVLRKAKKSFPELTLQFKRDGTDSCFK